MSSFKCFVLKNRFVVALTLFAGLVVTVGGMFKLASKWAEDDARRLKKAQEEISRLVRDFQRDIERAKRATADPCATVFYEVVAPPDGLTSAPRLIMMGQEISYISLDPSAYSLRPKGDRVELWMDFGSPVPPASPAEKIGEKFAPDSTKCK